MCRRTRWHCGCCGDDLTPGYYQNVKICEKPYTCRYWTTTHLQQIFDDCETCVKKKCYLRYREVKLAKLCNSSLRLGGTTSVDFMGASF